MRSGVSGFTFIAAAALTAFSACGNSHPNPAPSAAHVIVNVAGVDVTRLPTGYAAQGSPLASVSNGHEATVVDFSGRPANENLPQPLLTLNVSRDSAVDAPTEGDGAVSTTVVLHEISAKLTRFPHFKGTEGNSDSDLYILTWTERGAHLSVSGVYGATREDVVGFADGLVVDPRGKDVATADEERDVRAAFAAAFDGSQTPNPDKVLASVENGSELRAAYDRLVATLPATARSAKVVVQQVTFTSTDRANVQFAVSAAFKGRRSSLTVGGAQATRVDGSWKVSQAAYCQILQQPAISCP